MTFRLSPLHVIALALFAAGSVVGAAACGSSAVDGSTDPRTRTVDATAPRKDGTPVDLLDGGAPTDATAPPPPTCAKYCDLVMSNCTGDNMQYASASECAAFCAHLPETNDGEEKSAASLGCREYWADSPAHTNPKTACLAAGPYGGNVCGNRCKAFCDVLLSTCSPDGGTPAYGSPSECATACASFSYVDAGTDGGGEGPNGPKTGDTLNCRLFNLRAATANQQKCVALHPDGGVCKD